MIRPAVIFHPSSRVAVVEHPPQGWAHLIDLETRTPPTKRQNYHAVEARGFGERLVQSGGPCERGSGDIHAHCSPLGALEGIERGAVVG